jgi:hypothetical protein
MLRRSLFLGIAAATAASTGNAQSSFCAGWAAGWEAAFRNRNMIPAITPVCPIPKVGGDTYEAGFERGLIAGLGYIAQRRG